VKYYNLAVWVQGQMKWAKKAYNYSTYNVTHNQSETLKNKIFFSLQTQRLAEPFEGLNSL